MRRMLIAGLVSTFFLGATVSCAPVTVTDEAETSSAPLRSPDTEEGAFLKLLNDYRASKGLAPLVATPLLNQVAYDHSLDMGTHGYFDHNDQQGRSPFDRMKAAGYAGGYMAENIAAGNATGQATFDQWKGSPGHNANMIDAHYKAIGIGRAYVAGSPYGWYWTTDFGDVVDGSATSGGGGTDGGAPPPAPTPPPPPSGCAGPSEQEPNGDYGAPNTLGASVCGAIDPGSDQDWYTWSLAGAGVRYDVKLVASGDAQIAMWKIVNGQYSRITSTSATEIASTSTAAGTYLVLVWSPGARTQSYTLTSTH